MIQQKTLQSTSTLFMVRPVKFGFNEQTAASNAFQQQDNSANPALVQKRALAEFDAMVEILRGVGVEVIVFEDTPEPHTPDSIFPNNWISFHTNGKVVLYPLNAPNRRAERRMDIPEFFMERFGHSTLIDMSHHEQNELFLEGTGSMIFDRINQVAYACLSPRTDKSLFEEFCKSVDIEGVVFDAVDQNGQPIYHTNVMMALGTDVAIICLEAIPDTAQRVEVVDKITKSGRDIVDINFDQLNHFAGNMLEVSTQEGKPYMVMSKQAYDSLREEQQIDIRQHLDILAIPIDTIESYGGGSVRCMMAEVFS